MYYSRIIIRGGGEGTGNISAAAGVEIEAEGKGGLGERKLGEGKYLVAQPVGRHLQGRLAAKPSHCRA